MVAPGYVVVVDFDGVLTGYNNYKRWKQVVGDTQDANEMTKRLTESSWSLDINDRLVDFLEKALEAKKSGKVSAILFLTALTNLSYVWGAIGAVDILLQARGALQKDHSVFLHGSMGYAPRTIRESPTDKTLSDVEHLLEEVGLPTEHLASRIIYFDTKPGSLQRDVVIGGGIYVQITPPFGSNDDRTEYGRANRALENVGGKKRRGTRRTKSRRSRKTSSQ